ncbi:hypothetical protein BX666DRAFT_1034091 [Dichotomocladium elegans]|nr:hypothetical protein BX666DRAFT_1034091 [Dichotomocladium elegans]
MHYSLKRNHRGYIYLITDQNIPSLFLPHFSSSSSSSSSSSCRVKSSKTVTSFLFQTMSAIDVGSSCLDNEEIWVREFSHTESPCSPPPPYDASLIREAIPHSTIAYIRKYTRKKNRWSFSSLLRRLVKGQQPYIRTIFASGPTGDVLDREQQQDVLNKYFAYPQMPLQSHTPIDAQASDLTTLKSIWVFRLKSASSGHSNMPVWTTFDMANQELLTRYRFHTRGVEIYDSHIRQGKFPALVVPRCQLGYFPMDMVGNTIATLEVACLRNSKNLGFVYRKSPRNH